MQKSQAGRPCYDLVRKLEDVRSMKQLARVKAEAAFAYIKPLKVQLKDSDARCVKMVDKTAQVKKILRLRSTLSE